MRPLIAVPGRRAARVPILRFTATLAAEAICEAVWAGGGEPLVLHGPDGNPAAELADRLARFDGICMPGGADLDPRHYGQHPAAETEDPVAHQDAFDMAVISCAIGLGIPTLAICRGMQILNVVQGGDLVQHLTPSNVAHNNAVHDVVVAEDSRLIQVVGSTRIPVSSYHHQAVGVIGADLRVVGTADDGCVEALEHAAGTLLAVQWHPEDLHTSSASDAALFADLAERAAKSRAEALV
ncbi:MULTISPECIES: gamma-glutamyl-gamma-aminobutyrate hydrolase family protein [unclassified Mycolicibacterium]|uniref:gamma-glutamyl-gamma-aminobutyrate hydrolase family protein n=1 Tax=unclassified Mycolicibacterium TaxID=2636767 RepID=UPI0012DF5F17|nr:MULTISPECIES: gamma-glutamyl-gamma-aminobutyrate hydrolase family protein [unclassified Mycolicibacterium]MUL81294.1 gamma-glutamyl-gamma-aminobutyrate hydrolase family protein [Mycolicibacterium sp. CBMA 329]MUL87060.1 gamma-glutamyl-gamma-aminobutyrate hydrolase family protein [Mycolicibacterium sp. CBMA 331]MUL98657.1 gamma-glutamyl-gamma-aminobutyrate hydrolase family protein [Mycolicibacterium sp. CBMA 334]MUM28492.1 gamma-glutamyl-gamma-aminobutyrate hydrolase family protein [Mycolicib